MGGIAKGQAAMLARDLGLGKLLLQNWRGDFGISRLTTCLLPDQIGSPVCVW